MTKTYSAGVSNECACNLVSEVVQKAGRVRLRVSGSSMVPAMRPGDLITVERASLKDIAQGEIVVFARSGRLVVHRVLTTVHAPTKSGIARAPGNSREPLLRTRGDRARRPDPIVYSSELLGRVTQIERGGHRVQLGARARLSAATRAFTWVLRVSDRATALYLRVSSL